MIEEEYERLLKLFENLPQSQLDLLKPVLKNFAFMTCKLSDLRAAMADGRYDDEKQRKSDLADYNQTIKSYMAVYKELKDKLPAESGTKSKLSELLDG